MNDQFVGEALRKINLYEVLAEKLEEMIINDPLLMGEKLPAEQIIADNYGVSRNVVREALKILKERGLVELKNGEGAFIVKPKPQIFTKMINRMMLLSDVDFSDIYEIRFPLERETASLAAKNITQEELLHLRNLCTQMRNLSDDSDEWARLDLEFHLSIARATKNPLFYLLLKPFTDSLLVIFSKSLSISGAKSEGIKGHEQLLEAISNKEPEKARSLMHEHLTSSQKTIHKYSETLLEEHI